MLPFVLVGIALWVGLSVVVAVGVSRVFAQQHRLPTPQVRRIGRVVQESPTQVRAA